MRIFLLTAFLFIIRTSFASQFAQPVLSDTTSPEKEYKISRDEFLEKYGRDDSSRALINYYFSKRIAAKILFFSTSWQVPIWPFPLASNIRVTQSKSSNLSTGLGGLIGSIIFLSLLLASVGLASRGLGQWVKYSRKRLLQQLNNYSNRQPIPKGISKSHLFKRCLKAGSK